MKNIKSILTIVIALFSVVAMAQEKSIDLFTIPLSNPGKAGKLHLEQLSGSIDVVGYDGNEVVATATFGNKKGHYKSEKKRNGMTRIANTSLNISGEEKDNVVRISNEELNRAINLKIKVPRNFSLKLSTVNQGDIIVNGVNGELEISNVNGEITLNDVSGSATTDTVNGDIVVNFNTITADANMAFSSLNGDLKITFPSNLKADVKAKTDMGEIFTDFDLKLDATGPEVKQNNSNGTYKVNVEQWVRGKINGGGPEMLFKTFNGDIMIKSN
ncbi:DUF4097 family beta strand repeat-containing protein [uncultured Croceitalea sp.]|uniref:DUF4097 family beta strand repeat-containing protein n=1 Tax=uncultured Croceitalea sp. TaxID=1798908 RepID=UPI003305AE38